MKRLLRSDKLGQTFIIKFLKKKHSLYTRVEKPLLILTQ